MGKKDFEKAKKLYYGEWYDHPDLKDQGPAEYAKNQKACLDALDYYNRKDRPLNILAVHGSGRHPTIGCAHEIPNSEMLLEKALDPYRNEGYDIESVRLREYNISPCNNCVSTASLLCQFPCLCFPMDPMQELYPKTLRADVLLMSTGVNQAAMSTRLKAYVDRLISCFLDPDTEVFTLGGYKPIHRMKGKNKIKGNGRALKLLNGQGKWESPSQVIHNSSELYTGIAYEVSIENSFGEVKKFVTTDDHIWVLQNGDRARSDKLVEGNRISQLARKCIACESVIPLTNRVTCSDACFSAVYRKHLAKRRDGKTYEEWLGKEKAALLRKKIHKATVEHLTYNHENKFVYTAATVVSIKTKYVENMQKYCFTVDDDHSFVVGGGIVSGNCDGGVYHDFAVKDAEFRAKAIQASREGNFEYTQRLFGRVGAYFISSKDQNNPSDKEYDYVHWPSYFISRGSERKSTFTLNGQNK